jgi:hypothetical protein
MSPRSRISGEEMRIYLLIDDVATQGARDTPHLLAAFSSSLLLTASPHRISSPLPLRAELVAFYELVDPSKIASVDLLLRDYSIEDLNASLEVCACVRRREAARRPTSSAPSLPHLLTPYAVASPRRPSTSGCRRDGATACTGRKGVNGPPTTVVRLAMRLRRIRRSSSSSRRC